MNLDLEKKKLEYKKVEMAKFEMEFKKLERLEDIKRIEDNINNQIERMKDLKEQINTMEGMNG